MLTIHNAYDWHEFSSVPPTRALNGPISINPGVEALDNPDLWTGAAMFRDLECGRTGWGC